MKLILCSLGLYLICFPANAIHYFRMPQSLFASGECNEEKLEKYSAGSEFTFDYLVESDQRSFWIGAKDVATDIDLSQRLEFNQEEYQLKARQGSWVVMERISDSRLDWAPSNQLKPAAGDLGLALTLVTTSLRQGPSWTSDLLLQIPARTSLPIVEIHETWLRVKFESIEGFIDLNNVLLKADFATEVQDLHGIWHPVKFREGFMMVLDDNHNLPINKIQRWKTDHNRGVMLNTIDEKHLLLRQNLSIKKVHAETWKKAQLPGHGIVYWRPAEAKDHSTIGTGLTSEEILAREIFSVSFDKSAPDTGIISSHGIFATYDGGLHWQQLPEFKNENQPVSIGPNGTWYVGFFRSRDHGKTFQQYLRTDYLAKLLQSTNRGAAPRHLRVSEINFRAEHLQIKLETGVRTLHLDSQSRADIITDWRILN